MDHNRREFLHNVGWTLVSLAGARHLAGCGPAATGTTAGTTTGGAGSTTRSPTWLRLRSAWLDLPAMCTGGDGWNTDPDAADLERRKAGHRAALDELLAAGELRAPVAELLHNAFSDTAWHAWRSCNGPTCYEPTILGSTLMETRGRVVQRLEALDGMVASGTLDADLVAASRATFRQQLAILDAEEALSGLEGQARWDAESRLVDAIEAGGPEATDDEREAAGILVDLLLAE